MTALSTYPRFRLIDTASPPVSPKVVAAILMIQNAKATSGTLLGLEASTVV